MARRSVLNAPHYYILDAKGDPQPCADVKVWAAWFQTADRVVAKFSHGDIIVSTVFLGLDHSYSGGPPVLYETMVFGGLNDGYCARSATLADAKIAHGDVVVAEFGIDWGDLHQEPDPAAEYEDAMKSKEIYQELEGK